MNTLKAIGLAAILLAGPATGFAAVGSEQAREANARNAVGATGETSHTTTPNSPTMSMPNVPTHDGNSQFGYSARSGGMNTAKSGSGASGQSSGVTVGPGAAGHRGDHPLGYAKGAGESSSVGK
jgi:hypothetical protein